MIRHLPDASAFGRVEKYLFHLDRAADLHWTLQRVSRGQSIHTGLTPEEEKKQKEDNAKPATIVVEGQIPKKATQFAPLDTPDPMVVPNKAQPKKAPAPNPTTNLKNNDKDNTGNNKEAVKQAQNIKKGQTDSNNKNKQKTADKTVNVTSKTKSKDPVTKNTGKADKKSNVPQHGYNLRLQQTQM